MWRTLAPRPGREWLALHSMRDLATAGLSTEGRRICRRAQVTGTMRAPLAALPRREQPHSDARHSAKQGRAASSYRVTCPSGRDTMPKGHIASHRRNTVVGTNRAPLSRTLRGPIPFCVRHAHLLVPSFPVASLALPRAVACRKAARAAQQPFCPQSRRGAAVGAFGHARVQDASISLRCQLFGTRLGNDGSLSLGSLIASREVTDDVR